MKAAYHLYPSEIEDVWVAHCLTFDIMTQGEPHKTAGATKALFALIEAVRTCMLDDISRGLDPWQRPRASAEDWAKFERAFEKSVTPSRSPKIGSPRSVVGWLTCRASHLDAEVELFAEMYELL